MSQFICAEREQTDLHTDLCFMGKAPAISVILYSKPGKNNRVLTVVMVTATRFGLFGVNLCIFVELASEIERLPAQISPSKVSKLSNVGKVPCPWKQQQNEQAQCGN